MTINIVPSAGTIPKTGKFGVVASHPGTVTLTASDPRCILTPSSFVVGGAQTVEHCASGDNTGLVRRSDTDFLLRKNFTIGIQSIFKTNQYGVGPAAFNSYIAMNKITAGGYAWNWGIPVNGSLRRLGWYNDGPVTTLTFAQVFTADVEYRAVLKVEDTTVTLITLSGSETLNRTTPTAGWSGASWKLATFFVGGYQCLFCRQFQLFNGVAAAGDITAFLNNTGNLGSSLYCNLDFDEESGNIAYDTSGNSRDFDTNCSNWGTYTGKIANDGFLRTITTPFTNTEQSISYDTGIIPPGTNITITASRVKAGFPTGRVPDISTESDTAVFTVAPVSVTGITLNKASALLDIGDTTTLTATVWPK